MPNNNKFDSWPPWSCSRSGRSSRSYGLLVLRSADADVLGLGDDIGMQETIMMAPDMYRKWLKPRLSKVISAAKEATGWKILVAVYALFLLNRVP